jgi:hypothetical protein
MATATPCGAAAPCSRGTNKVFFFRTIGIGAFAMKSMNAVFSFAGCSGAFGLAVLVGSVAPAWAGAAPAPLAGAAGPVGLLVAAVGYGGYLLYKRYRRHD